MGLPVQQYDRMNRVKLAARGTTLIISNGTV